MGKVCCSRSDIVMWKSLFIGVIIKTNQLVSRMRVQATIGGY